MLKLLKILPICAVAFLASCAENKENETVKMVPPETPVFTPAPVALKPVAETISFEEGVKGTPFAAWLNRADATAVTLPKIDNGVVLTFLNAKDLTYVIKDHAPVAGEAYKVSINMQNLGEGSPRVRLLLARDCAGGAGDSGFEIFEPTKDMATYAVSHTFQNSYPCMKLVLQVLNAYPETSQTLAFAAPRVTKIN